MQHTQVVSARSAFVSWMALGGLGVALIGFSTTFFSPVVRGQFDAPVFVWLHGAMFFAWLLLLLYQAELVRSKQVAAHRRSGWVGAALALAMAASGVAVGAWAARRDLAAGMGDVARGQFVNILIEMALFLGLVAAAVVWRRDRGWHKRLILLATISVLAPAWLRFRHFLPAVANPFLVFSLIADAVLLIAVAHDLATTRRVHAAYWWAGTGMVAVHLVELTASETTLWVSVGRALLGEG